MNISIQRQLPGQMLLDTTFFANISHDLPYSQDINLADPRIAFAVGNEVNTSVPNPFYNLLPSTQMPGQLRTQANVAVSQLLRPYPQYSDIWEGLIGGRGDHYESMQISLRRPFTNGVNLSVGYNYNHEVDQEYYDATAEYLHQFLGRLPRLHISDSPSLRSMNCPWEESVNYEQRQLAVDNAFGGWASERNLYLQLGPSARIGSTSTTGTSQSSYTATSLTGRPIANGTGALMTADPALSNPTMDMAFSIPA